MKSNRETRRRHSVRNQWEGQRDARLGAVRLIAAFAKLQAGAKFGFRLQSVRCGINNVQNWCSRFAWLPCLDLAVQTGIAGHWPGIISRSSNWCGAFNVSHLLNMQMQLSDRRNPFFKAPRTLQTGSITAPPWHSDGCQWDPISQESNSVFTMNWQSENLEAGLIRSKSTNFTNLTDRDQNR